MNAVDVAVEFMHLTGATLPTGSTLNTRTVQVTEHEVVLVAVDADGHKHVLVPHSSEPVEQDFDSRALALTQRQLEIGSDLRLFADLACLDNRLGLVFERVVSDVIRRLEAGADSSTVCRIALQDWRAMFQAARAGTSDEVVVGLIGELQLLSDLGALSSPAEALKSWWGPDGHVHDFYSDSDHAIEVKTTRGLDANKVSISNLDQLDPKRVASLHLCVFAVRPDVKAPTLDERIRGLMESGYAADALIDKSAAAGHVFEGPTANDTRYSIRSRRVWEVGETFPGLKRSDLGDNRLQGVVNVKFDLRLEAAGKPMLDVETNSLLKSWDSA